MVVYLSNAFSLSMLTAPEVLVKIKELTVDDVKKLLQNDFISVIGHESTAQLLSQLLSLNIPVNRVSITLRPSDKLVVFQLTTRLSEGRVLTLDELKQLKYKFYLVEVVQ